MEDNIIPVQTYLNLPLEIVLGNKDYTDLQNKLIFIDKMLLKLNLDDQVIAHFIQNAKNNLKPNKRLSYVAVQRLTSDAKLALRGSILRKIVGQALIPFCCSLAMSHLYQWFCRVNRYNDKIVSKSKFEYLEKSIPEELSRKLNVDFFKDMLDQKKCNEIGFEKAFELNDLYADSTCIKANIHYPTDWILIKDMIRTLVKKIRLIRKRDLKIRMLDEPEALFSEINKLCMEMTFAYRKLDANAKRKAIFRKMKKLYKKVEGHAISHCEMLKSLSEADADRLFGLRTRASIIKKMEYIFELAPKAIKIAHDRIIGEKLTAREDKIISIYEGEAHIITRNKAGATSEFGNTGHITEQQDGIIVDYELLKEYSPGDAKLGIRSFERINSAFSFGSVKSITADRAYDAKEFHDWIKTHSDKLNIEILDSIALKDPKKFKELLDTNPKFKANHKRRGSTEAKIAHVNGFTENPMRQKGIENKQAHFGIAILAHNLVRVEKLYRLEQAAIKKRAKSA